MPHDAAFDAALALAPWAKLAYIDPGSGSFVLQILLAGIAAFVVATRRGWARIARSVASLFERRPRSPSTGRLEETRGDQSPPRAD